MKAVSWNVNGLRACLNKGFADVVRELDPDFSVCRKPSYKPGSWISRCPAIPVLGLRGKERLFWHNDFSQNRRFRFRSIGDEEHGHEGRCVTLEYPAFYMVTPLFAQLAGRAAPPALSPVVRGGAAALSCRPGREKAGDPLRRPQMSPIRRSI